MSYNLTELTDFVSENKDNIVVKAVLGSRTTQWVTVMPGIKTTEALTNLIPSAVLQSGACGWNPLGITKLGQRFLTVEDLIDMEATCTKDLEKKFLQLEIAQGANAGSADNPIEQEYVDGKVKANQRACDNLFWKGDKTSGNTRLNKITGILKILDTDMPDGVAVNLTAEVASAVQGGDYTTVTSVAHGFADMAKVTIAGTVNYNGTFEISNVTADTFDIPVVFVANEGALGTATDVDQKLARTASVKDDIDSAIAALPDEVWELDGMVAAMSVANYNALVKELRDDNNFAFTGTQGNFDFQFPGYNLQVVAQQGLSGNNSIVVYNKSNLIWGTDLEGDHETAFFKYDEFENEWRWRMNYRLGAQVAFPEEVVLVQ